MINFVSVLAVVLSLIFTPVLNSTPKSIYIGNARSLGIKTTAKSVLIIDQKSGEVIFKKNPNQVLPIASLTKLMTALTFLEKDRGDWERLIEIKKEDLTEPSKIGFTAGEKVVVRDLFYGSLVKSANDATRALVRTAFINSDRNFVELMNNKTRELGMSRTNFVEPTGLNERNKSTVMDLAKLVKAAFSRPEILDALQRPSFLFKTKKLNGKEMVYKVYNTNKLLNSFVKLTGAKTGHLEEVGYCYAGIFKTGEGRDFIIILLGSTSDQDRYQEVKGLIWWTNRLLQNKKFTKSTIGLGFKD